MMLRQVVVEFWSLKDWGRNPLWSRIVQKPLLPSRVEQTPTKTHQMKALGDAHRLRSLPVSHLSPTPKHQEETDSGTSHWRYLPWSRIARMPLQPSRLAHPTRVMTKRVFLAPWGPELDFSSSGLAACLRIAIALHQVISDPNKYMFP